MGSRRRAAWSTMVGGLANIGVLSLQTLLLVPLFLRYIPGKIFGAWLAAGDLLVWLQVFDLGLPNLMIQRVGEAQAKGNRERVVAWFQACFLILFTLSLLLLLAVTWLSVRVPYWLHLDEQVRVEITKAMWLAGVAAAGTMVSNAAVGFARGVQDTKLISTVSTISMVVGALVTICLVISGLGVMSIAMGMAVRAFIILAGGYVFLKRHNILEEPLRLRKDCLIEASHTVPIMAVGMIGFMLANQGELLLIGKFLSTELAIVFMLTRKLADLARSLVDSVTWSLFGGIAPLVASSERTRFWAIFQDITLLRRAVAVYLAAFYVVLNPIFVQVWAGKNKFGGCQLSFLVAVQLIVASDSFFMNYVYKAMGALKLTSLTLLLEGGGRVALALYLIPVFGLAAIPISAIIVATIFSIAQYHMIRAQFKDQSGKPLEIYVFIMFVCIMSVAGLTTLLYGLVSVAVYLGIAGIFILGGLVMTYFAFRGHPSLTTLFPGWSRKMVKQ